MDQSTIPAEYRLYQYTPSLAGAIIVAIVFAVLTAAHAWKIFRNRAFYFIPFLIGGIFEIVGYCARIWSHFDVNSIGGFAMQALLILLAPALFAASIYMILGRIMRAVKAESLSPVPVKWLTKLFVTSDIISFTIQLAGGGLQSAGTLDFLSIGRDLIIAGLAVQLVVFSSFIITAIIWHRRAANESISDVEIPWRRHLNVLYATSALILVRSIFRVIEYAAGNTGYLISHEVFLYVFDAFLMIIVMMVLLAFDILDLNLLQSSEAVDRKGRKYEVV